MNRTPIGWRLIARAELGSAIRNRQLHWFSGAFALLFGLAAYVYAGHRAIEPTFFLEVLSLLCLFVVPLSALSLSHEAIAKKRSAGQLKLVFGLPHTRTGVVLGTTVGRFAVVAAATVLGIAAATVVAAYRGLSLPLFELTAFVLVTLLLGLAFVAIGIGISASVRTTTFTAVAAFGAFLVFALAWQFVPAGLAYVVYGFETPASEPWWVGYVRAVSPINAYRELLDALVSGGSADRVTALSSASLVGWVVLPPALAALRFAESDL